MSLSATMRIVLGLACLALSVVLGADTLGLIPNQQAAVLEGRRVLAETIAIDCSVFATGGDVGGIKNSLDINVKRHHDIVAATIRHEDGSIVAHAGPELGIPVSATRQSSESLMYVPLVNGTKVWATLAIQYQPLRKSGMWGILGYPLVRLGIFVACSSVLFYYLYLKKMLTHLDPSKVVPDRVKKALDTLAEGLVVLDNEERIVLANRSFAETMGRTPAQLQGHRASDLPWICKDEQETTARFPWLQSLKDGRSQTGVVLGMKSNKNEQRTFVVNTSPISNSDGECQGALASFGDVTLIEEQKDKLSDMLVKLTESRDKIAEQNKTLKTLSRQDPLTGCLNRRAFFEEYETHLKAASRYGHALSVLMLDIDHFKAVNDNHGHGVGDQVLQKVAESIRSMARDTDLVCRYGGEEFCVLLTHTDVDSACATAERLRRGIESLVFNDLQVTVSLGVSACELGANDPQILLDQADKCLYVAKRNGRNQFIRWDNVCDEIDLLLEEEDKDSQTERTAEPQDNLPIPFHAVTALITALNYRDAATAEHSRRVADLCVATAEGMMSLGETYVLEIAALLHDIGKIGVPDSVLLKPGKLTPEEWRIMRTHDRIGVEMIRASFHSEELSDIVESHHSTFSKGANNANGRAGHDIPLRGRILTIADAYDAMVSDRVYRKGMSQQDAFDELQRCSGTQFDPELVERFIETVLSRDDNRRVITQPVSKQTALRIGSQMQNLASAMDNKDIAGMAALASHLKNTAAMEELGEIANLAAAIEQSASSPEGDVLQLVELTQSLLEVCRSTQTAYLQDRVVPETEIATVHLAERDTINLNQTVAAAVDCVEAGVD